MECTPGCLVCRVTAAAVPAWLAAPTAHDMGWHWALRVVGCPPPPLPPSEYLPTLRVVAREHGPQAAVAAVRRALSLPVPHGVPVDSGALEALLARLERESAR